jgi:threonylcarbamoyladenosine tRNA methylthiotransferase MtaB
MAGKFLIRTLGCKANLTDSQAIARELELRGWGEAAEGEAPGLCIVNSCTVTDEADRQSRKLASRLSRLNPDARVVVTGCSAEVDPERLAGTSGIHYVVGNRDKPRLVERVLEALERPRPERGEILGVARGYDEIASRHPMDREWPEPAGEAEFATTRAFLKIQEGCNAFCTYCIIPYGRGPSRSLRPIEVVSAVREACARGVRELVITGTNIGDYGTDLGEGPMLEELLGLVLAETPLERLRLSSLDPTEITPGILSLMEREPRLCPHFHVSLQSASSRVLRLMKRKYGERESRECLERIAGIARAPFVGMDVIAGFPGETEEEFESSFRLLESLPWSRLHVFPYSEREGTPATRLPGAVPPHVRSERARRLRELSLSRIRAHYERAISEARGGVIEGFLIERAHGGFASGYSPAYLRARVAEGTAARGEIVAVTPTGIAADPASGEVYFEAQVSRS